MLSRPKHHVGGLLGHPRRHHFLRSLPRRAVVAEIGVFRGEFTRDILRITRPRELHLIDVWWTQYGLHYPDWGPYTDYGRLSTQRAYEDTMSVVRRHRKGSDVRVHVGNDLEILAQFPDHYFDWVYLDTSHEYEPTLAELAILDRKVKNLLTGDDWIENPGHVNHGAYLAINEFCADSDWQVEHVDQFGQWRIVRT